MLQKGFINHTPSRLQLSATLKQLDAVKAPRVLLQLVSMLYWLHGSIPQDLDCVEYFAGCMQATPMLAYYLSGQVTKTFLESGYAACPYEVKLDSQTMDILSAQGLRGWHLNRVSWHARVVMS